MRAHPSLSLPHPFLMTDGSAAVPRVFLSCFRILAVSLGRRPWYYTASRARPCAPGWNKGSRVVGLSPSVPRPYLPATPGAARLPYTHLPLTYIPSAITTCPEPCNESISVRQIAAPPHPHTLHEGPVASRPLLSSRTSLSTPLLRRYFLLAPSSCRG